MLPHTPNKTNMKKYPNIVCITCANAAYKDTYGDKPFGSVYTVYIDKCNVCGNEDDCTEPRDFRYPDFTKHKLRLRKQKIQKINENINNSSI